MAVVVRDGRCRLGEAADVARSPGRGRDGAGALEAVPRGPELGRFEDEPSVATPAAESAALAAADGRVTARADGRERSPAPPRERGVRHRAAADQGARSRVGLPDRRRRPRRGPGAGAGRARPTGAGPVAVHVADRRRSLTGRSSRSAGRGCPDAPAALSRGSRPQTSSAPDDRMDRDHPGVGERDDRRRFEGREEASGSRATWPRARSSSGTCGRAPR